MPSWPGSWPSGDTPTTSAPGCSTGWRRSGLVDDADFAEQWVRSRRVNAGKGKRALAAELRTKGVRRRGDHRRVGRHRRRRRARAGRAAGPRQAAAGTAQRRRRHQGDAAGSSGCWPAAATASRWQLTSSRPSWPASANGAGSSRVPPWPPGPRVRLPARSPRHPAASERDVDRRSRRSSHTANIDSAKLTLIIRIAITIRAGRKLP